MKDDIKSENSHLVSDIKSAQKNSRIHSVASKTQHIYERAIKQPAINSISSAKKIGQNIDIARSKTISKFSSNPSAPLKATPKSPTKTTEILQHKTSPIQKNQDIKTTNNHSSRDLKQAAIEQAMNRIQPVVNNTKKKTKGFIKKHPRGIIFAILIILLVFTAGYAFYYLVPSASVQIAALRSGVKATYPQYHPDGYSLSGFISSNDDEVTINFKSNTSSNEYKIIQTNSSWDSTALKSQVTDDSNGEFITLESNGLTIFSYDDTAKWINGGILYTISGNAPLSSDQIQRIATSF